VTKNTTTPTVSDTEPYDTKKSCRYCWTVKDCRRFPLQTTLSEYRFS